MINMINAFKAEIVILLFFACQSKSTNSPEMWHIHRGMTLTVQISVQGQQVGLVQAAEGGIVHVIWQRWRHPGQRCALREAALRRLLLVSRTAVLKPNLGNFTHDVIMQQVYVCTCVCRVGTNIKTM